MLRLCALLVTLTIPVVAHGAETPPAKDLVGDVYELRLTATSEWSRGGSSGNSTTGNLLIERVVALRDDGAVELVFDLPEDTSVRDRTRSWQFPARVLKRHGQALQLLNEDELTARNRAWLAAGTIPESACGHWIFTWTAIKIECDPASVLATLAAFDLRPAEVRDGAQYVDAAALRPAPLRMTEAETGGVIYVAEMPIDPRRSDGSVPKRPWQQRK